jgi:YVTN family beta-propeller protein
MQANSSALLATIALAGTVAGIAAGTAACSESTRPVQYQAWDGAAAFDLPPLAVPQIARADRGDIGLTCDAFSDTVTVVDLAARKVIAVLPVGRNPVDVDGPWHLAFDRPRGLLYVALAYPQGVGGAHGLHGSSERPGWLQQWRISPFSLLSETVVPRNPGDIALSQDAKRLVIAHFDLVRGRQKEGAITLLQPQGPGQVGGTKGIPVCVAPSAVVLSRPDGATAFVACNGEDALAVVGLAGTPTVTLAKLPDEPGLPGSPHVGPYTLALAPAGDRVAVSTSIALDLRVFDVGSRSFTPLALTALGKPMWPAWSAAGDRLWLPVQHTDAIKVADPAKAAFVGQRTLAADECRSPHQAVFSSNYKILWLVCEGDGKGPGRLAALDPDTLTPLGTVSVGVQPVWMEVVAP